VSKDTAERWVTISAVIVAGIYAYRRLTEPAGAPLTLKSAAGVGQLPPLGAWATAWGFTYLVLAILTEASPGIGGSFAILIATADFLTNSSSVFADVGKRQQPTGPPDQIKFPGIGVTDQSAFVNTPLKPPPAATQGGKP
jgi:hypothetical protein